MGAIWSKGRSNMSCSTNATRSGGASVSSTTSSARPTESASASCSGSPLTIGSGTCASRGSSGRAVREPWLTPLAAVGLAIIVLMAAGFHLRADERLNAIEAGLWASIAGVIAIGRWDRVVATHAGAPPWVVVAALGLLVPAVIINLVVLFSRPVTEGLLPKAR